MTTSATARVSPRQSPPAQLPGSARVIPATHVMYRSDAPRPPAPGGAPGADRPLRLQLSARGIRAGLLDGAWWPYSRDLARELPPLLAVLDPLLGRITHVTVHREAWPSIPGRVPGVGHIARLGWYDVEQDPDTICLLSYTVGRWDLLVVPPDATAADAARAMDAACLVDNTTSSSDLVAAMGRPALAGRSAARLLTDATDAAPAGQPAA
jgi:hypothetical protein